MEINAGYFFGAAAFVGVVIVLVFRWGEKHPTEDDDLRPELFGGPPMSDILENPEMKDLLNFSKANNDTKNIPCVQIIENRKLNFIAKLGSSCTSSDTMVHFESDDRDVVWKNRIKRALFLLNIPRNNVSSKTQDDEMIH